jgi:hypothetical protein
MRGLRRAHAGRDVLSQDLAAPSRTRAYCAAHEIKGGRQECLPHMQRRVLEYPA